MLHPAPPLAQFDPELWAAIAAENRRQEDHIELIASENYTSPRCWRRRAPCSPTSTPKATPASATTAAASTWTSPSSWPSTAPRQLFGCEYANVQPHSGSQANRRSTSRRSSRATPSWACRCAHGGHLTHGSPVNFSGKLYNVVPYGLDRRPRRSTTTQVERLAQEHKPKMIVAGASAYSRGHRLEALPRDRRQRRRASDGGHGALCGPGRAGALSQPGRHRRLRHQHHPQDPARPARRHHPRAGRAREGAQLGDLSRRCRAAR